MDLILWRHAEAELQLPGMTDAERALTPKGRKQATRMAAWLDRHLPGGCRILASPAVRTQQTAQALKRDFKTSPLLAPDVPVASVLEAAHWPAGRGAVLVVGHQPTLGRVASLLIAGVEQDWVLRKGSIFWIGQKAGGEGSLHYIRTVLGADNVTR